MSGLLSDCCSVCYTKQPKYKCPRCKTQTCSLPCYKKHQQRASCNGQRDPAAFVKKSQWATPTGIDHDYNYLKTVEQRIERADEEIKARTTDPAKSNKWHAEGQLQRYLQQNRITVIRAPIGMSRARSNRTRVTQSGKVFWTVEWIDENGNAVIVDDIPDSSKITEAYMATKSRQLKAARRSLVKEDESSPNKRRRLDSDSSTGTQQKGEDSISVITKGTEGRDDPPRPIEHDRRPVLHFYLQRTQGRPGLTVLIQLDAGQELTAALAGQSIQEFPTIYALPHNRDNLPSTFITGEAFLASQITGKAAVNEAVITSSQKAIDEQPTLPDAEKILRMLRRDVRTA